MKIAVIGAGIAGMSAAYLLGKRHEVTLFEKQSRLGGHTNTRLVEEADGNVIPIDTGFIVCNKRNYPLFYRFLAELGAALQDSDMSFGFYSEQSGLQYLGPAPFDFLKEPRNLLNINILRMLLTQRRFNSDVLGRLNRGELQTETLKEYLGRTSTNDYFRDNYLIPLIASIWSSPEITTLDLPMTTFATFFRNHGMLELSQRPQWQTVVGGSHAYLKAFEGKFQGSIRYQGAVEIHRNDEIVTVKTKDGEKSSFDAIVLATHADESLQLLCDPTPEEGTLLGSWRYSHNCATLHTDSNILHGPRRMWASWNYRRRRHGGEASQAPVNITYYMNRLQRLKTKRDYFVSLNSEEVIDPSKILYRTDYTHPVYTAESVATQDRLRRLNGTHNTYYCGAYMRYGFHEDGIQSAVNVAERLGCGW